MGRLPGLKGLVIYTVFLFALTMPPFSTIGSHGGFFNRAAAFANMHKRASLPLKLRIATPYSGQKRESSSQTKLKGEP